VRPGCRTQPPNPQGTCPVGSPRRISQRVSPPLRVLKGRVQVRSIEDVTRMIALISVELCGAGSPPPKALGGGWDGLGEDRKHQQVNVDFSLSKGYISIGNSITQRVEQHVRKHRIS